MLVDPFEADATRNSTFCGARPRGDDATSVAWLRRVVRFRLVGRASGDVESALSS